METTAPQIGDRVRITSSPYFTLRTGQLGRVTRILEATSPEGTTVYDVKPDKVVFPFISDELAFYGREIEVLK